MDKYRKTKKNKIKTINRISNFKIIHFEFSAIKL